jgi:preprotein translocase subunit SecA
MFKLFKGLIDSNEREIKRLQPYIDQINGLEPAYEGLSDAELRATTSEFKGRLEDGESLDDMLPEAFAAVREGAKRTIRQRHFDVQLMGGIVLHQGKIAEMRTGEGKTLVATLPLYLNALAGQGCHLVTVNDYLARRDCRWMGPIYHALGLTVASINAQQTAGQPAPSYLYDPDYESDDKAWNALRPVTRRQAYEADITYGTNNEFGFDYLRDNMVLDLSQCVQRRLNYAIVDEVDNILIDEARTPLIISGAAEEAAKKYYAFAQVVARLSKDEDYTIDERTRTAILTDAGITRVEKMLRKEGLLKAPDLYDPSNYSLTQYLDSALKAHVLFRRDKDYVVKDGQVIIVDEFTGRLMFGRRYSEGLHQAIEAKERVKIQRESVTLATITFQNYFRLYEKLAGMTGTAVTEAEEFHKIYKLEVVVMPTNRPMIRIDETDQIYKDEKAKFAAVAREIKELNDQTRPVLIGTTSIEKSERLSDLLKRNGVSHQVLNAKHHEKEAAIIAQAGRLGAVTVATNMAGRGVDIILGGNPEERDGAGWQEDHDKVVELGGLHIIGTEHHEARRIDNQLRGRAGRQGDPGSSRFYASLEDEIVRRFGGDRVKGLMQWAGMDENTPIEHPIVNRAMTNAQVQTEGHNFDIRKHLVEYDDVINQHREVVYAERRKILSGADLKSNTLSMVQDEIEAVFSDDNILSLIRRDIKSRVYSYLDGKRGTADLGGLLKSLSECMPIPVGFNAADVRDLDTAQIIEKLSEHAKKLYEQWEPNVEGESMELAEHLIMPALIENHLVDQISDGPNGRRRVLGLFAELPAKFSARTLARRPREQSVADLVEHAQDLYERLEHEVGTDRMRRREQEIMLRSIDYSWMQHLTRMDDLRRGIGLRAVGQEQPLIVYKKEGHALFDALMAGIQHDVARSIYHVGVTKEAPRKKEAVPVGRKVGRNDPCTCGSGKKYKHCCGK